MNDINTEILKNVEELEFTYSSSECIDSLAGVERPSSSRHAGSLERLPQS